MGIDANPSLLSRTGMKLCAQRRQTSTQFGTISCGFFIERLKRVAANDPDILLGCYMLSVLETSCLIIVVSNSHDQRLIKCLFLECE